MTWALHYVAFTLCIQHTSCVRLVSIVPRVKIPRQVFFFNWERTRGVKHTTEQIAELLWYQISLTWYVLDITWEEFDISLRACREISSVSNILVLVSTHINYHFWEVWNAWYFNIRTLSLWTCMFLEISSTLSLLNCVKKRKWYLVSQQFTKVHFNIFCNLSHCVFDTSAIQGFLVSESFYQK